MNKTEFLSDLRDRLAGLSEPDITRSLDYYEEMINDRIEDGLSEEDAVAAIGEPADIAAEILSDMPIAKLIKARVKPKRKLSPLDILLLVLGFPVWGSLLIALLAVAFSVYAAIWSAIIALWSVVLALASSALVCLLGFPFVIAANGFPVGLITLGAAIFLAGISIFAFLACLQITRLLCALTKKLFHFVKRSLFRKEAVQ